MFEFRKEIENKIVVMMTTEDPAFIINPETMEMLGYGDHQELLKILPKYSAYGVIVEAQKDQKLLDLLMQNQNFFIRFYGLALRKSL